MDIATFAFAALYQFADAFAFLVLSACGLAVIFGMMGVINLAHGEFIMCGAYVTATAVHAGLPLPLAILAGALVSAVVGMLVEFVVVRHLYERPLDTIVATWGLSLIATQGTLIVIGSTMAGVGTPFGSFQVGAYSYSIYRIVLFLAALGVLGSLYSLFNWTSFGVKARATIQVPHMADALGVDTRWIYSLTFACGAGLAGACRRALRADHDAGSDDGRDLPDGGVRHGRDRRRRRLPRHRAGRRGPRGGEIGDDLLAGPVVRSDRPVGRGDHRGPGAAERHLRLPAARTDLREARVNGLISLFRRLEGPQTKGRGKLFWSVFVLALLGALAYPMFSDGYTVGNTAYFFVWVFIALSLCLIWGYGGALSFGQTAFFGIAGYSYGILTLNFGAAYGFTLVAVLAAIAIAAVVALLLGYFMFFGRIEGVFLGIVTLAVTLMLERFMAQTAGPEWRIGAARLNGFNGMSGMPPITIPWFDGPIVLFADVGLYYLILALVVVVYLGLRILVNSSFGNVIVAIRENPSAPKCSATTSASISSSISSSAPDSPGCRACSTPPGANTSRLRAWA